MLLKIKAKKLKKLNSLGKDKLASENVNGVNSTKW